MLLLNLLESLYLKVIILTEISLRIRREKQDLLIRLFNNFYGQKNENTCNWRYS